MEQYLAQVLGFLPHLGRDDKNDASGLEISFIVLVTVNMLENRYTRPKGKVQAEPLSE